MDRLTGEIHFHPRTVFGNNYGDQDMTLSYLAHSNFPPYSSVGLSISAFAVHLLVFEPKILEGLYANPRSAKISWIINFRDLKYTLTSCLPSAFVHKSYSDISFLLQSQISVSSSRIVSARMSSITKSRLLIIDKR